jgi:hypothetical protein
LSGCAGKFEYTPPTKQEKPIENSKIINKPKDIVWNNAIAQLGKQFFVINNMDKSSGFMNISFSADPEQYIDCGNISSYVKNARGERTYNFPASKASQTYEIFEMEPTAILLRIERKMSMEGRINLVFEEIGKNQTRVTSNIKYIVTKEGQSRPMNGAYPQNFKDTVSFNTNQIGVFPAPTKCISTGKLEKEILDAIQ